MDFLAANHVHIVGLCGLVCRLSVCHVMFSIAAKRYVLAKNCMKERIGNQDQKVDFLGRRHISTSGFAFMATETTVFALFLPCLLYTSPSPRDRTRSRMPSSA